MKVTVYLNVEQDEKGRLATSGRGFGEDRYQASDKLEPVYVYTIEGVGMDLGLQNVLENTFAMLNRGSGSFVGDFFYPFASLSVGDVIDVDGVRYSVEPVGFKVRT